MYSKALIDSLNEDSINNFPHIKPINEDYQLFFDGV